MTGKNKIRQASSKAEEVRHSAKPKINQDLSSSNQSQGIRCLICHWLPPRSSILCSSIIRLIISSLNLKPEMALKIVWKADKH